MFMCYLGQAFPHVFETIITLKTDDEVAARLERYADDLCGKAGV